ncbi:MAG: protein kinase family protein [Methylococcales bacterium]|nr:protein kinase family protein [Methylococcales bacterium]
MGHVFSIEDSNGNSKFALKYLQHFIPDDNNHRSLINEWEKAQTINHKNVICYHGFHDGLTEPKTPYLIMELAQDGSLEDFLKSQTEFMDEREKGVRALLMVWQGKSITCCVFIKRALTPFC